MKCAVIILSSLALGYALPTFGGDKRVSLDQDNTITIDGYLGKKVVISKVQESPGQRNVEIYFENRTGPTKKIWFKDQTNQDQSELKTQDEPTEADILLRIFKDHQGTIDDDTFGDILRKIRHFVQTGHVDKAVLDILKSFDHRDQDTLDVDQSSEVESLKKLLKLLKTSGYHHKNIDVDRIIKENAVLIDPSASHEAVQDHLDELETFLHRHQNLKRLLQGNREGWTHNRHPFSSEELLGDQHQAKENQELWEIGQESPLFRRHDQRQESWITREKLFDRNLRRLSRGQGQFAESALPKFHDALDQDDDLKHLFIEGKEITLRKVMNPETADGGIGTDKWFIAGQGRGHGDRVQNVQEPWQHHSSRHFTPPYQALFNQR